MVQACGISWNLVFIITGDPRLWTSESGGSAGHSGGPEGTGTGCLSVS